MHYSSGVKKTKQYCVCFWMRRKNSSTVEDVTMVTSAKLSASGNLQYRKHDEFVVNIVLLFS